MFEFRNTLKIEDRSRSRETPSASWPTTNASFCGNSMRASSVSAVRTREINGKRLPRKHMHSGSAHVWHWASRQLSTQRTYTEIRGQRNAIRHTAQHIPYSHSTRTHTPHTTHALLCMQCNNALCARVECAYAHVLILACARAHTQCTDTVTQCERHITLCTFRHRS
jgi:hypothetical protein